MRDGGGSVVVDAGGRQAAGRTGEGPDAGAGSRGEYQHYCGIDLHSRTLTFHVSDGRRKVRSGKIKNSEDELLRVLGPYRRDLLVGVECTYNHDWLVEACDRHGIAVRLGDPAKVRALSRQKGKGDAQDAELLAKLLAGDLFPEVYVYPASLLAGRKLVRTRADYVSLRASLLTRLENSTHDRSRDGTEPSTVRTRAARRGHRRGPDVPDLAGSCDRALLELLDSNIDVLELEIRVAVRRDFPQVFERLLGVTGIGETLAAVICYEVGSIERFPDEMKFASYARLVPRAKVSGGRRAGVASRLDGNAKLKQAFQRAASCMLQWSPAARAWRCGKQSAKSDRLARSILAARLGRAVYSLWAAGTPVAEDRLLG